MNQPPNPYAPPKFEAGADARYYGSAEGLRREGDAVVIPVNGTRFPDRCVVCNQPAVKRLSRKLYWHQPAIYALAFVALLIYAIVALIVRKSVEVEIGLCDAHAKRRRNGYLLGWLGFAACLVGIFMVIDRAPAVIFVFLIGMIGFPVAGILMTQVVKAKRIDDQFAWLKVGRPFLDSIYALDLV
jgi:hypothetical protein